MEVVMEWNTICRICLQEGELHSIFDKDEDDWFISDKIMECSNLKIEDGQNLPEQICDMCLSELNAAHRFRNNCEKSNAILESLAKADMEKDTVVYSVKGKLYTYEPPHGLNVKRIPTASSQQAQQSSSSFSPSPSPIVEEIYNYESHDEFDEESLTGNEIPAETCEIIVEEEQIQDQIIESQFQTEISGDDTIVSSVPAKKSRASKKNSTSSGGKQARRKGEKPLWVCDLCGNVFKYKHALEIHMRRHRQEKPFACEICGRAFVLNVELTCHMRTHTGQKPYACRFCERRFSDFGSRIKHERSHTGERPYACETCGKTFAYSYGLSSHILTHTGEKPHRCEKCGKRFTKKHHLKNHLKTHMKQEQILKMPQLIQSIGQSNDDSQNCDENLLVVLSSPSQMENMEQYVEEMEMIDEEENIEYEQKPSILFDSESEAVMS